MPTSTIDRDAIAATETLIRPHIRQTPVLTVEGRDVGVNVDQIRFKLEFLQHSGSFKARGAMANLLSLPAPPSSVVAASGGNHGAAVAFAAQRLGIPATIFVPGISPQAKLDRIRSYGADLVVVGEHYADAYAASREHAARTGAHQIHAYDAEQTLLGQGTVGVELEQDFPDTETLLVAVGGGGLIGGIAAWYEGRVRVVAVEPVTAPSLHAALAAGEPVDVPVSGVAADSLGARRVGSLMFPIAQAHVADSVLVPDDAIRNAQAVLWDALRIVAEPGGAAAFAALLYGRYRPAAGERVVVLLCGANTSVTL
jgi:threonine dehydratase